MKSATKKFVFVDTTVDMAVAASQINAAGITCFEQTKATAKIDHTDVALMAKHIATVAGMTVETGHNKAGAWEQSTAASNDTSIHILSGSTFASGGNGGLTIRIGDTSDSFNQMNVAVGDMHTKAMGKGKTTLDGKEVNVNKTHCRHR